MKSFVVILALCVATQSLAGPITVPPDLQPGDQYRLVFVTSGTIDGTSTDISVYNNFVTNAANSDPALAALGTTWSAIASTATVDARDNTNTNPNVGTGVPIYDVMGNLVASSNANLWTNTNSANIPYDQNGLIHPNALVWTGTDISGQAYLPLGLGDSAGQGPTVGFFFYPGTNIDTNQLWIQALENPYLTSEWPLYAISGILTVPVPEPRSIVLAGIAFLGLIAWALRLRPCGTRL